MYLNSSNNTAETKATTFWTFQVGQDNAGPFDLESIHQHPLDTLPAWLEESEADRDQKTFILNRLEDSKGKGAYVFIFRIILRPSNYQSFQVLSTVVKRRCEV